MILVDTSIWVDHLRAGDEGLAALLDASRVLTHPFVIGELALGNLRQRERVLSALHGLPPATTAGDEEVLHFIRQERLWGSGVGYVDVHLLAAVVLTPGASLWTRDQRLSAVASRLELASARP